MKRTFLPFLLILPSILNAQVNISKTKKQIIESKKEGKISITSETDSTLHLKVDSSGYIPVNLFYHFNKEGKCDSEQVITGSGSSFTKYLDMVLGIKKYYWKKINENQYISDFHSAMIIEIPPENKEWSFTILYVSWTKQLYDMLTEN